MRTRHDSITQTFHWGVALMVIAIYAIGLGREALPKGDARTMLLGLHMSLGIALMAALALRLSWRLFAPSVEPVPMNEGARLAARLAHLGLYGLLVAVPLFGLFGAWLKGRTVGVFGLTMPPPFSLDRTAAKWLEEAHEISANALIALAALHAFAALAHQFIAKDQVLARMLPGKLGT